MYESFFRLARRPFTSAPAAVRQYPAASIKAAGDTLLRVIERAEGAGLLVGPAGTGKTQLLRMLADNLRGRFTVVLLSGGRLGTRRDLWQTLCFELALPYRGLDEGELRLALVDHLMGEGCPAGLVLLVDEAHTLPVRLLDELRMLTNLVAEGQPRVRLVLAGGPGLEERLASPKLESLSQRLAARCYLDPLDPRETAELIKAQIAAARDGSRSRQTSGNWPAGPNSGEFGYEELFSHEAYDAVYRATDGIPRLIHQLCDQALVLACKNGSRRVEKRTVEEAWVNLQQLPTPWSEPVHASVRSQGQGSVVEFGSLDDESSPHAPREESDAGIRHAERDGYIAPAHDAEQVDVTPTAQWSDELFQSEPVAEVAVRSHGRQTVGGAAHALASVATVAEVARLRAAAANPNSGESGYAPLCDVESQTHSHLDQLEDYCLSLKADVSDGGVLPEVELVFDEPYEEPLAAEHCSGCPTGSNDGCHPHPAFQAENQPMIEEDAVEEVVFDHYAALDAHKGKSWGAGVARLPAPQPAPAAGRASNPSAHDAAPAASAVLASRTAVKSSARSAVFDKPNAWQETEKSLTLAEALVRHATAIEQAALLAQDESVYSILSTPPAAQGDAGVWQSFDLLAPTSADHPEPLEAAPAVEMTVDHHPEIVEPTEPHSLIMDKPPHTDDWNCGTLPLSASEAETLCDGHLPRASGGRKPPEYSASGGRKPPEYSASEPEFSVSVPEPEFIASLERRSPQFTSDDVPSIRIQLPAAHGHRAEPDLIVIEEEPAEAAVETPVQAAPVKRNEYRRLFAKLRKG